MDQRQDHDFGEYQALRFQVDARCSTTKARAGIMVLPHGPVSTPVFQPVGTQGTLKGITQKQLENLGCEHNSAIVLTRARIEAWTGGSRHTWRSAQIPGLEQKLTDCGGFQMVSLLKLAHITEEGVRFLSPHDGTPMLLSPEHSISLQNSIGADIMMQLDDVVSSVTTGPRVEEAMWRSIRWLDRCIKANKRPHDQNLFAIIQGGLDLDLRRICCEEMAKRNTPGVAVGGLSGGEEKVQTFKVVNTCTDYLPEDKPRYLMGVGYAEDMVVAVALGIDMFDCVYPTRTARFGNAITPRGVLNLRHKSFLDDFSPVDEDCTCPCCAPGPHRITRSFICHTACKETVSAHLLTLHNVHYQLNLMRQARQAIMEDSFPQFVKSFFHTLHAGRKERYPLWAVDALKLVNVDLLEGQDVALDPSSKEEKLQFLTKEQQQRQEQDSPLPH